MVGDTLKFKSILKKSWVFMRIWMHWTLKKTWYQGCWEVSLVYRYWRGLFTLQGINISHLGKRKIIFKMPFLGGYVSSLEGRYWSYGFCHSIYQSRWKVKKGMPLPVPPCWGCCLELFGMIWIKFKQAIYCKLVKSDWWKNWFLSSIEFYTNVFNLNSLEVRNFSPLNSSDPGGAFLWGLQVMNFLADCELKIPQILKITG